jgi:predicted lipoprotein with Yx(FWY)xxD motif
VTTGAVSPPELISGRRTGTATLAGVAAAMLLGASSLAGCGSSTSSAVSAAAEPTLLVESEPGYGPALTDPSGAVLYVWVHAGGGTLRCTGECARTWIPIVVAEGATAQAGVGVRAGLIGTVAHPGGGRMVTYAGRPLYDYLGDHTTFSVRGAGVAVDGGTFSPVAPDGAAERGPAT